MTLIDDLKAAGLSEYEAKVYQALLQSGEQTGRQVSDKSEVPKTRVFDTLEKLKDKGLVQLVSQRPLIWSPLKPEVGIKLFIERKIESYNQIEKQLLDTTKKIQRLPEEKIEEKVVTVSGFDAVFALITDNYKKALKNIIVYSVGEKIPYSTEVEAARAIKRGVDYRMVATKYDDENKEILKRWIKDGWRIKYLKGSREYTFVAIDRKHLIIVVKNPMLKNERIAILFENPDLTQALAEYFNTLWKKGKQISGG